jgi:hypothetical protein
MALLLGVSVYFKQIFLHICARHNIARGTRSGCGCCLTLPCPCHNTTYQNPVRACTLGIAFNCLSHRAQVISHLICLTVFCLCRDIFLFLLFFKSALRKCDK